MKTATNEQRFICDNWDKPEVEVKGQGKGKVPARKVVTRETIVITVDELFALIHKDLRQGNEVRLAESHVGEFLRIVPMMDASLTKMFVEAKTMGKFRTDTLADKKVQFTRRGTNVSEYTAKAFVEQKRNEQKTEIEQVTPDTMVTCPRCKYTFRVGRRI